MERGNTMAKKRLKIYDATDTYKTRLEPLIKQIRDTCAIEGIPFMLTIAIRNSDTETEYKTDSFLTGSAGIELKEDKFPNLLLALNGGVFMAPHLAKEIRDGDLSVIEKEAEMLNAQEMSDEEFEEAYLKAELEKQDNGAGGIVFLGDL